jgi:UDP:flavonoid glycosyltransferase YjiC (YdhE family)
VALRRRGHCVGLQTWSGWRKHIDREGIAFFPAPEYQVFPTRDKPLKPYEAAVRATTDTRRQIQAYRPDAVVSDILTVAGGLAAELEGCPWATLVPHVLPHTERGFPPYSTGARLPRTAIGRFVWHAFAPLVERGLRLGREELNQARRRVGLPATARLHAGISDKLCLVATLPALEYPRRGWGESVRIIGPLLWEQQYPPTQALRGSGPLVLIAPSTSQDPNQKLLSQALPALAGQPVRVLATTNGRQLDPTIAVPDNVRVVSWLSHGHMMPRCQAVVCHAGHGTIARALCAGTPVLACPVSGDMAENGARLAWAGAGISLPRHLQSARGIRLGVRALLSETRYAETAKGLAHWARENDPAHTASIELERLAAQRPSPG